MGKMKKGVRNQCWIGFLLWLVGVMVALQASAEDLKSSPNTTAPDPTKLVGRWQRPDGGYILQFSDPLFDGRIKAAYFNPQSIHVARAAWKHQNGYLGVFVELRAPNYPGSTYTLVYDAKRDRLVGIYFQAALQQEFQVEFERMP
jgi:hypothetical protein